MKLRFTKILLLTCALIFARGNWFALAQSNGVPGSTDYSAFSRFISARNIFDPNRYAKIGSRPRPRPRPYTYSKSAPTFSLVGTMSYGKGLFAFFDGNDSDLKKILKVNGEIADYTVTKISPTVVTLQSADKKQIELRVGDLMRQESGHWELAGQGEVPTGTSSPISGNGETPAAAENNSVPSTGNSAADEVLKRLMQQKEQEK
jgi:hypothetical protein